MTNSEYSNDSFETTPKWEGLRSDIVAHLERASLKIEKADTARIAYTIKELNDTLRSEGIIGLPMQVKTGLPLFMGKSLTEEGVEEHALLVPELLKKQKFEGIFRGCTARPVQSDADMTLIFYDVELSEEDNIHLEAAVDASKVKVEYEDVDNWEEGVHAAFAVLEAVEDEEYQEAVTELRRAFWDNSGNLLTRMKNLGFHATALLSSEMYGESSKLNDAIELILICSLDPDVLYETRGIDMLETVNEKGQPVVYLKQMSENRILKPIEIQYMTYFEVLKVEGSHVEVQLLDAKQPVYIFLDPRTRQEVAIPLRYFASIKESTYDEQLVLSTPRVITPIQGSTITNDMTCGELYHEYVRKQEEAKISWGGELQKDLDNES